MIMSKKTIIFQGFRGLIRGGSNFFQGGSNANFFRNGYNL